MPKGLAANIRRGRIPFAVPAGGLTPPTVRDKTSYASAATETSGAVPIPTNAQSGDVHYIFCELTAATGAITTPTGYTAVVAQFDSESSTSAESACFRKDTTLSGGGGSVTISFTSGRFAAASLAIADADTSAFEDVAGASDNGPAAGTTSVDAPSVTPANAGTLLLTGHTGRTNTDVTNSFTKPSGMTTEEVDVGTNVVGASNASVEVCSLAVTDTNATGVQTATASATVNASGMSVLVRGLAGAGAQSITPASIRTDETLGAPTVTPGAVTVAPIAVPSGELVGTVVTTLTVAPTSITTSEIVGAAQVGQGLAPTGVQSNEQFGAVTTTSVATISPVGIPTAEQLGTVFVGQLTTLTPGTITSGERFGVAAVTQVISPASIGSTERLGTSITSLFITPASIPSEQRIGTASVAQAIAATSIQTGERLGALTVTPGTATIAPISILSAEQHGTSAIAVAQPQTVSPASIISAQALGTAQIAQALTVASIQSSERFGSAIATPGAVTIAPSSIPSAQAFGATGLDFTITPFGIRSTERLGVAQLATAITPASIPAGDQFGIAQLIPGVVQITPAGIVSTFAAGNVVITIVFGESITVTYESTSYTTAWEAVVDYAYDSTASPDEFVSAGGG